MPQRLPLEFSIRTEFQLLSAIACYNGTHLASFPFLPCLTAPLYDHGFLGSPPKSTACAQITNLGACFWGIQPIRLVS